MGNNKEHPKEKEKEKRSIQISVQIPPSMLESMRLSAKYNNSKFQPAKELYALAELGKKCRDNKNLLDVEELSTLKEYEKRLEKREKAVEDMLLIIKELEKVGKKIKLVDIGE